MKAQRASSSGKIESPYFSISPTKCNCEAWTLDTKQTYEDSERWEEGRLSPGTVGPRYDTVVSGLGFPFICLPPLCKTYC